MATIEPNAPARKKGPKYTLPQLTFKARSGQRLKKAIERAKWGLGVHKLTAGQRSACAFFVSPIGRD